MVLIISNFIFLVIGTFSSVINLITRIFKKIFRDKIRKFGILISLGVGILLSSGNFVFGFKCFLLTLYFYYLVIIGWFIRKYYNTNLAAFIGVLKIAAIILVFDLIIGISIFQEPLLFEPITNVGEYQLMPFFGFASLTGLLASRQLTKNTLIQFIIKWSITGALLLVLAWWIGAIEDLPSLIKTVLDIMQKIIKAAIEVFKIFTEGGT